MCLFFLAIYRKLDICECRTRKAFMEETRVEGSFLQIRHVILDEVQNFQAEDGDWLEEARKLVRQHIECESIHDGYASDNESVFELFNESETDPGYLWCFMDKGQRIHKSKACRPEPLPQTFILNKVIRNSKQIFNYAQIFLDKRIWRRSQSVTSEGKSVTIGHDFDGEHSEVEYSKGERIACLIGVLKSLLEEGYSKGDIAVLCYTKPLEGYELEQFLQEFPSTVNAERNDDDNNIVLSTVKEYGGLERPVVIVVDRSFDLIRDFWFSRVCYCALTRGMVKLITLAKKSRGQKRKETN